MNTNDGRGAYWAVVPAAGCSRRMGHGLPKQYRSLDDRRVIEHSLAHFLDHPQIRGIVVVVGSGDAVWQTLPVARHPRVTTAAGGAERWQSVLGGLRALADRAAADDRVLVHDAARPCLARADLDALMYDADALAHGGLLAVPVADTLKRGDREDRVTETVDRATLWRALTPQMFGYAQLCGALERIESDGVVVTDDAAAVERLGGRPCLVRGRADNIKVTVDEDLALAAFILGRQSGSREVS